MTDPARVSPAEAHAKMQNESFTYVDVRTEDEFAAGHPEGAFNVPISHASASGRSAKAQQGLISAGFTRVLDQSAGWAGKKGNFGETLEAGWSKSSLPTETGHPAARAYATLKE